MEVYLEKSGAIWFGVAVSENRILSSTFGSEQEKVISHLSRHIPRNVSFEVTNQPSTFAKNMIACQKNIYKGKNHETNFPLNTDRLPPYTQKVLSAASLIPVGYVASYGSTAKAVGGGPRAVGNVMANNPFVPLVPCHRVVKSDFTLGGYGLGLQVKRELLTREKKGYTQIKKIKLGNSCLEIFPIEKVFFSKRAAK